MGTEAAVHRTLWRYIPATTDAELERLGRLRGIGPEEGEASLGGRLVRFRLALVVEAPCDGKAAVGVELSFPGADGADGADRADHTVESQAWGLCEEALERHLGR